MDADIAAEGPRTPDLRQTLLEYQAILENAPIGIAFTRDRVFQQVNPRFEEMFGWPEGTLAGQSGGVVWPTAQDYMEIGRTLGPLLAQGKPVDHERTMQRRDGSEFLGRLRAKAIDPNNPALGGTIWIIEDVTDYRRSLEALKQARSELEHRVEQRTIELAATNAKLTEEIAERQQAEGRIRHLAHHDALTGLPNRRLLEERLDQAIAQARSAGDVACVMFIDLDRFKTINDSLGHSTGDELLQIVAGRLRDCLRPGDTVSRVGGDEFVLVLPRIGSDDAAAAVAGRVIDLLSLPYSIDGNPLRITPSIGISMYPRDGENSRALIGYADSAMYQAKSVGRRSLQFYTNALEGSQPHRLRLENDLHGALERSELVLYYQPRFDLREGTLCGSEALLRWRHPERGLIGPAEFIPLAEDTGLIVPIGEWVLREACEQNRRWRARGLAIAPVAVNLSARQFRADGRLDVIPALLHEAGLAPRMLEVEITESVLMHHTQETVGTLASLNALGVRISIDDFGTGYSSLAYLKRFPVDTLKIDRSFVRDVTTDPDDAAIVEAIIGLSRSLALRVVAEGVETPAQREFLARAGCDEVQGYLFGRPMPAGEFERLLAPHAARGVDR